MSNSPTGFRVDPADLSLSTAEIQEWMVAAQQRIVAHEQGLAEAPVIGDVSGEGLRGYLPHTPPLWGRSPAELLDIVFEDLVPRSYNTASPGHFGWIPAGGLFPAAVADLVAGAVNRYTGMYSAAPALVQLEADVLRWFCDWFDLPPQASGLFTTGGSLATFSAVVCARTAAGGWDPARTVVYTSADAHLSVAKAFRLAGLPSSALRRVAVDERRRMLPEALAAAVAADRARGSVPAMVVATAGTTFSGAVDPLSQIADIAAREALWLHVDAAYGGFFRLVPALRPVLAGIERADSLTVDPHKSLFLPYGTGALLVRDGSLLAEAHAATDSYLPPPPATGARYDPSQHGPALSRDFPGLRVWLTLQAFGVRRITAALAEKHQLAVSAAERLRALPELELLAAPELSLFAFRIRVPGRSPEAQDADTRRLVERVCAGGRTLLTGCRIGDRDYARVCVLSHRTRARHVDRMVADILLAARAAGPAIPAHRPPPLG